MANTTETVEFEIEIKDLHIFENKPKPVRITDDMPPWKKSLLRKKELERTEKHNIKLAQQQEESQIPEWKRPLVKLHSRRKSEQSEKEEMKRKKEENARKYFESLPAWKQNLILKKRSQRCESMETATQADSYCKDIPESTVTNYTMNLNSDDELQRLFQMKNIGGRGTRYKIRENKDQNKTHETSLGAVKENGHRCNGGNAV